MYQTTKDVVSDAEIERVHANANFGGGRTKRQIVDEGLLQYAFGYSSGYTMKCILEEHGLIRKTRGYHSSPTKKGTTYLRAMFNGVSLGEIVDMQRGSTND